MAVYRRAYRPYSGATTAAWARFTVITRNALETMKRSRMLTVYFVLCLVPAIVAAGIIYMYNSPIVRGLIGLGDPPFAIDARYFYYLLAIQGSMVFLITAWVGPTLVAPDLNNNALQLYLSRPLTRTDYVLGKMTVLVSTLSLLTWVPDLLLFGYHGLLAGGGWIGKNLNVAWAIFMSAILWIVVQSLMALAISAWVKWRIVASGLLVGIFFVAAGFGQAINAVLRTYWGNLLNLQYLLQTVWRELFDLPEVTRGSRRYLESGTIEDIPVGIAWMMIALLSFGCLLMLNRRLRAKEVVRG